MDADGLPLIGIGIDLTKVEAIPAKRTLAFMNHFISHTAAFLNRFSCVCEEKLETLSIRIQRLETTMSILEAKLASIPGLDNITPATTATQQQPTSQTTPAGEPTSVPPAVANIPNGDAVAGSSTTDDGANANQPAAVEIDPRYARYFQMIRMGVPLMAIRQKVIMEGLDPNVLENPSAAAAATKLAAAPTAAAPVAAVPGAAAAIVPAAVAADSASAVNDSDSDFSNDQDESCSTGDDSESSSSGFDD